MSAEAVGEQQPTQSGVGTEKGIVVKIVNGQVASPGTFELYGFESRYALGKCRPDSSVEHCVVNIKIELQGFSSGPGARRAM